MVQSVADGENSFLADCTKDSECSSVIKGIELRPILNNLYNLSDAEETALRFYTDNGYYLLNRYFRGWGSGDLFRAELASTMIRGLSRLPKYIGVTYREVDAKPKFPLGATIVFRSFTSTSVKADFHMFEPGYRVKLVIYSKTGRDISSYATRPYEREILFLPGTKLKVLPVPESESGVAVYLQEID
jgi:hypothetical protein